ncbi:MAG: apolipoprotein N-acyltransferase [Rhodobacter sp.]|nr:apolipoprotein N-acyltransferase [Rhodobacter sp.]
MEERKLQNTLPRRALVGLLLATAAGISLIIALPPHSVAPLALVAFGLLAVLPLGQSAFKASGFGYVLGLGRFVPGLLWITESFQVEADRFGWLALPAVLGLAALLSVFRALARNLAARMERAGLPLAVWIATGWTAMKWLRGHALTGFPWNLAAYTLADWLIAAQASSEVGNYGLGYPLVLSAALAGLAFFTPDGKFRVVQPNIPQSAKWDEGSRKADILRLPALSARPGDYDILLWPETAWPGSLAEDTGARVMLGWLLPETGVLLAGSPERGAETAGTECRNAVIAISPDGTVLARHAKHLLVAFGKHIPRRDLLPFQRLVQSFGDFLPGPRPCTLALGPYPSAGVAIGCEIIFPRHVVDDAIRPDRIFNATNDAWFGASMGPWQHLTSARMRAIEDGLPLVRAANTGIPAVVDAYGATLAMLDIETSGVINRRMPRPLPPTLYARFGDWTVLQHVLVSWGVCGYWGRRQQAYLKGTST